MYPRRARRHRVGLGGPGPSSERLSLFSPRRAGRCGVDLARTDSVLRRALSLLSAPCREVRRGFGEDQPRPPTGSLSSLCAVPKGTAWIWRGRTASPDKLSLFSPRRAERYGVDFSHVTGCRIDQGGPRPQPSTPFRTVSRARLLFMTWTSRSEVGRPHRIDRFSFQEI
jgi:hypothetical protein